MQRPPSHASASRALTRWRRLLAPCSLALLLAACGSGNGSNAAPQLRVVDDAYAATNNFDVLVNSVSAVTDLGYGGVTALQGAAEGGNTVVFEPTGTTTTVLTASFPAAKGYDYTVFALESSSSLSALIVAQGSASVAAGEAQLNFVSAYPGQGALDIYLTAPTADLPASPTIAALGFQGTDSSAIAPTALTVAAGDYRLRAFAPGDTSSAVFDSGPITFASGANLLLAINQASGSAAPFNLLVLGLDGSDFTIADQRVNLRLGSFAPAAGTLDTYLDPTGEGNTSANVFFAGLGAFDVTPYQAELPAAYRVSMTDSGSTLEIVGASEALGPGTARSIFAIGLAGQASPNQLQLLALTDDLSAPANGQAKLRIVHVAPDLAPVDIVLLDVSGATPVIVRRIGADLSYTGASSYASLVAGSYTVAVVPTGQDTPLLPSSGGSQLDLSAGTVYTLVIDGCRFPGSGICGGASAALQLDLLTDR
jgi:hypothetical protein